MAAQSRGNGTNFDWLRKSCEISTCDLSPNGNPEKYGRPMKSAVMGDSSQFSPLTTLSEQLGPNSWVSSVFIPAFIANIGKLFFLKYDSEYSKSI